MLHRPLKFGVTRATLRLDLDLAFAPAGTPGELVAAQRFPEPTSDAEAIERLTRYVLDGSSADGDHSRVLCAVLAVRDEPDSSLAVPALLQHRCWLRRQLRRVRPRSLGA